MITLPGGHEIPQETPSHGTLADFAFCQRRPACSRKDCRLRFQRATIVTRPDDI